MHAEKPDLQPALAELLRQGGIRPLADLPTSRHLPAISTGFQPLDHLLGCRGIPQRRLTIFTGFPTSGATTLAYHLLAQAQRLHQVAVYLDLDHCFDPLYARRCGVEINALLLSRPENRIEAVALLRDLAGEDIPVLAVLDSLLLHQPLPDLRALRSVLPRSQTTLLLLLPPGLARTIDSDVSLHFRQRAWLYQRRDVRGLVSAVTVMHDLGRPAGTQIELEIGL